MPSKKQLLTSNDILVHWEQGKSSLDWRGLTDYEKGQWLIACGKWSGIPRTTIRAFNYIIPGNQVASERDFYCLLGETIFGYRGYFGGSIDAFDDCFSEIHKHEPTGTLVQPGTTVTITHHQDLANAVSERIPEHWNYILETFSNRGFKVILE
jgi:hypothetical protein